MRSSVQRPTRMGTTVPRGYRAAAARTRKSPGTGGGTNVGVRDVRACLRWLVSPKARSAPSCGARKPPACTRKYRVATRHLWIVPRRAESDIATACTRRRLA
jgi:hypothetical protein